MKKFYYAVPFLAFPLVYLLVTAIDGLNIVNTEITRWATVALFLLLSAAVGNLSPAKTRFDVIITALVPISFYLTLFVTLFFDEGCDGGPQLSLSHALNAAYYKQWFFWVAAMTVIAFAASFKPIRIIKNEKWLSL